ncbi:mucin-17-like [Mixophyes fleayi]|uniref:mucin-17-like n=1 Tax=Mixophyes fleayi TaxID=3061075 RepID=UPI003F4D8FED
MGSPKDIEVECLNGGYDDGIRCICPVQFYGPRCENLVDRVEFECLNGGYDDGIRCICPVQFYGPRCENLVDRVEFGKTIETSVTVEVKFTEITFNETLEDSGTKEYEIFENYFKIEMNSFYASIPEYIDVKINKISNGSVNVDYDIILMIEFKADVNVSKQYSDIVKKLQTQFDEQNCTGSSFCILEIEGRNITSEEDLCKQIFPIGFQKYIFSKITAGGLICVTHCSNEYPDAPNCKDGSCQIQNGTGPQCFCPETDLYIYTSSNCQGKILKSGVYGGVGVSIAILFIAILLMVFFIFKRGTGEKWDMFANEREDNWYEDKEDEWQVDRGITNLSDNSDKDSAINNYSSNIKTFTPALENIDTTLVVKIRRPEISSA